MKRLGVAVAGLLLLMLGIYGFLLSGKPALPVLAMPQGASPAFTAALKPALAAATSEPSAEHWRELARLYQANHFNAEARALWRAFEDAGFRAISADHYARAMLDISEGDLAAARSHLMTLKESEPSVPAVRLLLAEVSFKSGDVEGSESEYRTARALAPGLPQAAVGIARIQLQRGDLAGARTTLEEIMLEVPDAVSAAALLSTLYGREGKADQAGAMAAVSRKHAEVPPADPFREQLFSYCYDVQALSLRFEEQLFGGRLKDAGPVLERIQELDPQSWIPYMLRAWSLFQGKQWDCASTEFEAALNHGGDPERLGPMAVSSYISAGNPGAGLALAEKLKTKKPDSEALLSCCAEAAVAAGDQVRAMEYFRAILAKSPTDYAANMGLAKRHWSNRRFIEALPYLERVAAAFSTDVVSRGLLGEYYLERKEPGRVLEYIEPVVTFAKEGSEARKGLIALLIGAYTLEADRLLAQNRLGDALGVFERWIAVAGPDPEVLAGAANCAAGLKEFGRAARHIEAMIVLRPSDASLQLTLGDLLYQNQQPEPALIAWQRARELTTPSDPLRAPLEDRLSGRIDASTFQ